MLFQHSLIYIASRAFSVAAMLVAAYAYTRLLSPQEVGFYTLVNTSVTLAFTIAMLWICLSGLRLLHATQDRAALRMALLFCYLAVLTLIGVAVVVALIFVQESQYQVFILIGFAMFAIVGWLELNLHLLIAEPRPIEYGCLNAFRASAGVAFGIAFVFAGWGASGALIGSLLAMLFPSAWFAARYWCRIRLRSPGVPAFREITVYGLPLLGSSGLSGLTRSMDRLLIAALAGTHVVGLYAIGFNIADNLITAIMAPIGSAGFALAVRVLEREGYHAALRQLAENVIFLIGIGLPAAAGLVLVSENVVDTLIGPEFRDAAKAVIPILAFGSLLNGIRSYYFDHAFQLGRRTGLQTAMMLLVVIASLAANMILIPLYGAIGAATAMLLTHVFGILLAFVLGRHAFHLPWPMRDIAKIVAATGIMAIAVSTLPRFQGMIWLILQIVVGVVAYLVAALALDAGGLRAKTLRWWRNA